MSSVHVPSLLLPRLARRVLLGTKERRHISSPCTICRSPTDTSSDDNNSNPAQAAEGYKSIGSFHSESVELLATLPEDEYTAPTLPFDDCPTLYQPKPPALLASDASDAYDYGKDFYIDRTNWTFLNHGAFGGALKVGHWRAESWRRHLETQPLRYFDRDLLPHLAHSNRLMADLINGKRDATTLIQNATVGLNAIIGGYTREYKADGTIIYFDVAYGSVKKMAKHYSNQVGGKIVEIPVQEQCLPLRVDSEDKAAQTIIGAFESAIDAIQKEEGSVANTNALLILDHTTSNTAINIPVEKLARKAKEYNMLVAIDGAHGMLAQKLNMKELEEAGVDFYVGNYHKWFSAPRGAAVLYCPHEHLRDAVLRMPPVISHGVDDGFISRFLWDGCRDYGGQLCLPIVLDYWRSVGLDAVRSKMRETTAEAVNVLAQLWHPSVGEGDLVISGITMAPLSMLSPLALVRLPEPLCGNGDDTTAVRTSTDAKQVQDFLFANGVECPIKCINGKLYVRISSHIYNRREEYELMGRKVLEFPSFRF